MATINLLPEAPKGGIDLTPTISDVVDPVVLEDRAQKAEYGMGEFSPGYREVLSSLHLGAEGTLREQVSMQDAVNTRNQRNQQVSALALSAATEGRPITVEERQWITQQLAVEPKDPAIVLEDLYARRFINGLEDMPDWTTFQEAFAEAPASAEAVRDAGQTMLTKQEIAARVLQEAQGRFQSQNWMQTGVDFAKNVLPGYNWWQTRDRIEGVGSDSVFIGQNIQEQIRGLYLLPPAEFEKRLREAVTEMGAENALGAVTFASQIMEYSIADATWDNLFTGLDAVDLAFLGAGTVIGTASAASRYAKRVKSAVQGNAAPGGGAAARAVLQGNIPAASNIQVLNRLSTSVPTGTSATPDAVIAGATRPQKQIEDLRSQVQGLLDPNAPLRNAGSLSVERARRLGDALAEQTRLLYGSMTDVSAIPRVIAPDAIKKAFENAERNMTRQYSKMEDAIVDTQWVRESEDIYGGVDHVRMLIGKKDASGFGTPQQANVVARGSYKLPKGGYEVIEKDGNYFISVTKTVDETDLAVRDLRIQTEYATPETFVNTWLGWLRTSEDLLSRAHSAQRVQATFGGNAVMLRLSESAQALGTLGKNEMQRLSSVMDEARFKWRNIVDTDGKVKQVQGLFYKNVDEFEKAYLAKGYPMPSDKETQAYFEFKNLSDWDYAQRNAGMLRDKARLGLEQQSIMVAQADEAGELTKKQTEFFEGRVLEALPPTGRSPYTVMWIDDKTGKADFGISNQLYAAQRKALDALIESGQYKIIQTADSRSDILAGIVGPKGKSLAGGEPVQYIVVKNHQTKPLSSVQIPYNEGGHWNYPATGTYLKQPSTHRTRFGRRVYDGDTTVQYFQTGHDGKKFQKAWQEGQRMLRENDPRFDQFVSSNLPYSGPEFARMFRGAKGAPDDAPFDLDAPFVLTNSGQGTGDVIKLSDQFGEELVDLAGSEHSLNNLINSQYSQQRNERLTTIETTGTQANPVYKLDVAPMMDPLESLARNATQMAKSRFFEDYKHSAIEDWVTQFADVLDVPIGDLRADPLRYLREPVYRTDTLSGAKLNAARNSRRSILQLLSMDGEDVAAWKWTRQKIVDGVAKAHGNKPLKVLDPLLWDSKTDPATIVRSVPFHAYLGLFNPVQYFLQGSAVSMAMAIDGNPIRAAQSVFAFWAMRNRGLMETNVKATGLFSKKVSGALGVPEHQLDEMYDLWKRSGAQLIGGEHARIDDALNPRMFYGAKGLASALDAGTFFFKEGNNVQRGTSFALAYLGWRQKNPTAKITPKVLTQIIDRTNTLSLNMTRASNASYQGGGSMLAKIASVPSQFFSFQARLNEQLLSGGLGANGRLTRAEKARLLAANTAMWGVGGGALGSVAGAFWPFQESVRQYALENNLPIDEGFPKLLMDGVVSMSVEGMTGQDLDIEGRLGPGGLGWLRDLLDGESFEVMGAGPSFLTEAYRQTAPFAMAMVDVFSGNGNMKLVEATFIDAIRVSSTANNLHKAYMVWTAGQYLTKDGSPLMTAEPGNPVATIAAALGMTPQEVADAYLMLRSNKDFEEAKASVIKDASVWFERGLKAAADGDDAQTRAFFDKATAIMATGDFTPMERAAAMKRAMRVNQDLIDKVSSDFLKNDVSRMNLDVERDNPWVTGGK